MRELERQSAPPALALGARLGEQEAREALADLTQRERLDQLGAAAQAGGQDLERGQSDLGVRDGEAAHVALVEEEDRGRLVGGDRRGEGAVVEDWHLGDGRAGALDVDDLLAPVETLPEGAHRALDHDVEPARLLAREEEHLVALVAPLDGSLGQDPERALVQLAEERGAFECRDLIHCPYLTVSRSEFKQAAGPTEREDRLLPPAPNTQHPLPV